jgi:hypothetical protein
MFNTNQMTAAEHLDLDVGEMLSIRCSFFEISNNIILFA